MLEKDILARLNNLQVGGFTTIVKVSGSQIAVQGAAYGTGDVLGTTSPIAVELPRSQTGTAILQSLTIQDLSNQKLAIDLIVFDSNPTATTFTDNGVLDIADGDLPKVIGVVSVVAGDYAGFNDNAVATKNNIGLVLKSLATSRTQLWICLVTRATPTYAVNELSITLGILQD